MDINFTIVRTAVMAKVEGLTVMLSQHNPGVPYETLWASAGDHGKLDLYYKEAIGDFEDALKRWINSSSNKFDYLMVGSDYNASFKVPANWPTKLRGLLENKTQDYFAHTILSAWLADLPEGTPVKPDYLTIAASDLESIKDTLLERDFSATPSDRTADSDTVNPHNDMTNWSNWDEVKTKTNTL